MNKTKIIHCRAALWSHMFCSMYVRIVTNISAPLWFIFCSMNVSIMSYIIPAPSMCPLWLTHVLPQVCEHYDSHIPCSLNVYIMTHTFSAPYMCTLLLTHILLHVCESSHRFSALCMWAWIIMEQKCESHNGAEMWESQFSHTWSRNVSHNAPIHETEYMWVL